MVVSLFSSFCELRMSVYKSRRSAKRLLRLFEEWGERIERKVIRLDLVGCKRESKVLLGLQRPYSNARATHGVPRALGSAVGHKQLMDSLEVRIDKIAGIMKICVVAS